MDEEFRLGFELNVSRSGTEYVYPLPMRSDGEVIAETIVACALMFSGLLGNGIVCYTIHRSRYTKSSMYYFMLHLAYADLLLSCVSVPLTLLSTRPQPLLTSIAQAPCKIIRFVQYILPQASVAILAATSIDRYYSICRPLNFVITTKRTNLIVAGCWSFAFLLTSPIFYLIETRKAVYQNTIYVYCPIKETSTYPSAGKIYLIIRGVVGFVMPLLIIVAMYYKVMKTVWQRNSRKESFSAIHNQKLNVVKTLVLVVIAFSLSWAPFSITNKYFLLWKTELNQINTVEIITFWIGLSASVYNPFIYAFYNKNFREALKDVLFKSSSRGRKSSVGVISPKYCHRATTLPDLTALSDPYTNPRDTPTSFRDRARTYNCKVPHEVAVSENVSKRQVNVRGNNSPPPGRNSSSQNLAAEIARKKENVKKLDNTGTDLLQDKGGSETVITANKIFCAARQDSEGSFPSIDSNGTEMPEIVGHRHTILISPVVTDNYDEYEDVFQDESQRLNTLSSPAVDSFDLNTRRRNRLIIRHTSYNLTNHRNNFHDRQKHLMKDVDLKKIGRLETPKQE